MSFQRKGPGKRQLQPTENGCMYKDNQLLLNTPGQANYFDTMYNVRHVIDTDDRDTFALIVFARYSSGFLAHEC